VDGINNKISKQYKNNSFMDAKSLTNMIYYLSLARIALLGSEIEISSYSQALQALLPIEKWET
jgi:hypothetical protein